MARGDREELIVWDDEQGIKLPSLKDASRRYGDETVNLLIREGAFPAGRTL